MSYVVLARKYHPRHFAQMVGQEHVVQALGNALTQQRLHHAYLFTGTRGVGKTTVSRILAKSLNCVGADGQGGITAQPCGQCQPCRDIDAGRFVDYTELDAASNRGVEEVQGLLEQAVYKPVQGRFKVFMIDEVHMLTNTAFNAMLKTLEEPPEYLKFVLATTDPQKVPVTVLSRCLQFNLRPMAPETIVAHLRTVLAQEALEADEGALHLLARAARGSMRDALSLTDQAIAFAGNVLREGAVGQMLGAVNKSHVLALVQALAEGDAAGAVNTVTQLRQQGLSAASTLEEMSLLLQRMAVHQWAPAAQSDSRDPFVQDEIRLARLLAPDETQLLYSLCLHGRAELGLAPDEYAGLTMVLLRLFAFKPSSKPSDNALDKPSVTQPEKSAEPPPVELLEKKSLNFPLSSIRPSPDTVGLGTSAATTGRAARMLANEDMSDAAMPPDMDDLPPWDTLPEMPRAEASAWVAVPVREQPFPAQAQATAQGVELHPSALGDLWFDRVLALVKTGAITALHRELALQSQWVAQDGEVWRLRTERASLAQGHTSERLTQALQEAGFGQALRLEFEVGPVSDSPALRQQALAKAAQQKAEVVLMADPFVQKMMREFGGKMVPGTLRAAPDTNA